MNKIFTVLITCTILVVLVACSTTTEQTIQSSKYIGCPEGIIPEIISFYIRSEGVGGLYDGLIIARIPNYAFKESTWADGEPVQRYVESGVQNMPPDCRKGNEEGENINYYYCNDLQYYKEITPISSDGQIGKTQINNYIVRVVVKEMYRYNDTKTPYSIVNMGDFKVLDATCVKT